MVIVEKRTYNHGIIEYRFKKDSNGYFGFNGKSTKYWHLVKHYNRTLECIDIPHFRTKDFGFRDLICLTKFDKTYSSLYTIPPQLLRGLLKPVAYTDDLKCKDKCDLEFHYLWHEQYHTIFLAEKISRKSLKLKKVELIEYETVTHKMRK